MFYSNILIILELVLMQGLLLCFIDCRGASVYILVLMTIERKWAQQVINLMYLATAFFA